MGNWTILVLATYLSSVIATPIPTPRLHPDVGLNIFDLAKKYGYKIERHQNIETEDGYLLEAHRIPHGLNDSNLSVRNPVLLMHGTQSSSADFVNLGPGRCLAFLLADAGYDVWLANARGTTWSRKHKTLNPDVDKKQYWNISLHEIGYYDLPALIDYTLLKTGHKNLYYIGHSQGSTVFFVMASSRPEYNDKIRVMQALGPAVYVNNLKSPIPKMLAPYIREVEQFFNFLELYELSLPNKLVESVAKLFCQEHHPTNRICADLFFIFVGFDQDQLEDEMLPVFLTNFPAGQATKQLYHFAQFVKSGEFRQYDYYSEELNMKVYGEPTPPVYNLSKISAPIALHYSRNDWLVSVKDVDSLASELPNVILKHEVEFDKFNHIDYIWAKDANILVYKDVISTLRNF